MGAKMPQNRVKTERFDSQSLKKEQKMAKERMVRLPGYVCMVPTDEVSSDDLRAAISTYRFRLHRWVSSH
jgi:hypothetical protein